MRSIVRAGVPLSALALVLAGCGGTHPGAAAVVDDEVVSMSTVDDATDAYCRLNLLRAEQQGVTSIPGEQVRREALLEIVLAGVAEKVAEAEGIVVRPSDVELSPAERTEVETLFEGADTELVEAIERGRFTAAVAEELGARSTGEEPTAENGQELLEAGSTVLLAALDVADATFDPRFGLSGQGEVVARTGSLAVSDDVLDENAPVDAPATQTCS